MSFRNRCIIPAANGPVTLSVPLDGGREITLPMKDVRIDNSVDWQQRHWRTIVSAYGRSPWFEYYADGLEQYYVRKYTYLVDLNLELLQWIYTCLGCKMTIDLLAQEPPGGINEPVLDLRNKILPKNFKDFVLVENLPVYTQVFQDKIGFQPNMSIIDLIFCEGRNAVKYLG